MVGNPSLETRKTKMQFQHHNILRKRLKNSLNRRMEDWIVGIVNKFTKSSNANNSVQCF